MLYRGTLTKCPPPGGEALMLAVRLCRVKYQVGLPYVVVFFRGVGAWPAPYSVPYPFETELNRTALLGEINTLILLTRRLRQLAFRPVAMKLQISRQPSM